jgi:DNA-binding Xre family transcriptional regulator
MTKRRSAPTVSYRWKLRVVMAEHGMFSTTELVPHLSERGIVLSREQVYRLAAKVPERLSLTTLAALCDIFDCSPAELIEVVPALEATNAPSLSAPRAAPRDIRPRRARVIRDSSS